MRHRYQCKAATRPRCIATWNAWLTHEDDVGSGGSVRTKRTGGRDGSGYYISFTVMLSCMKSQSPYFGRDTTVHRVNELCSTFFYWSKFVCSSMRYIWCCFLADAYILQCFVALPKLTPPRAPWRLRGRRCSLRQSHFDYATQKCDTSIAAPWNIYVACCTYWWFGLKLLRWGIVCGGKSHWRSWCPVADRGASEEDLIGSSQRKSVSIYELEYTWNTEALSTDNRWTNEIS